MPFSHQLKTSGHITNISKSLSHIFFYFNSWGGSFQQSMYLKEPLSNISKTFYVFTIDISNIGGFNYHTIPENEILESDVFKKSINTLLGQALIQTITFINEIMYKYPDKKIICMSHSLGYTMLFTALQHSNLNDHMHRLEKIILLDPAGKGMTETESNLNRDVYGTFINKFKNLASTISSNCNPYQEWTALINKSTKPQFTDYELTTGMYQYIIDCDNSSQLDLSIYAFGIESWNINHIIEKLTKQSPNLIYLLTTTNGMAYQNINYWNKLGITNVKIVSNAGHFLHIFSQEETINTILRLLKLEPYHFQLYGTSYNAPL